MRPEVRSNASGLGLATLSALVVANMVGAGVFTSSGFALEALGNPGRVMLGWCVCGLWAICGALAYGALASRLPLSGGEYLFLSRLVHPSIGFLAGWISVVAGFTAPIAVAAQGAAVYGLSGVDSGDWRLTAVAVGVILLATLCHLSGLQLGTGLQNAIVAAKLLLLVVFIAWAFLFTRDALWQGGALTDRNADWWPENFSAWTELVGSMSWIALSYTGFNAAIYVAGQSHNARRNVPRAMFVATVVVTVLYLLLNVIFVYGPRPESIANQKEVAAIAAVAIGGQKLSWLVRTIIVLAMTSSVFAMLLAGPRVYQKMAEDGVMPKLFAGGGTAPRLATLVQAALSILVVFLADLLQLMTYLGLTLSACGALAVLSLWWVRKRVPEAAPLRWWETLATSVYLAITLLILLASRTTHADEFTAMLWTFAIGAVAYGISAARKPLPKSCGPYALVEKIGGGRVADVFRARSALSTDAVVVKVLSAPKQTPLSKDRFTRESQLLSEIGHINLVRFVDAGTTADGGMYLAMEALSGSSLYTWVQRHGAMEERQAVQILVDVCNGLAALHAVGVLHGDLSPKNVMFTSANGITSAKIIDLGLARRVTDSLDESIDDAQISGTPAFMSPEACRASSKLCVPSEVYSIGCLAYYLLSGELPLAGATSIEICWNQIHTTPKPLNDAQTQGTSPELNSLVMQCLSKPIHLRPQTVGEVQSRLQQILDKLLTTVAQR